MKKQDFSDMLRKEMDGVRVSPALRRRTLDAARKKEEPIVMKKMSAALVCALMILAISSVALAAAARMGMLDFAGRYMGAEKPTQDMAAYIESPDIALEDAYVTANVRELYYDGLLVRAVIDVTPKGNAMLVALDAEPEMPFANLTGDYTIDGPNDPTTVADYYLQHGFERFIVVDAGLRDHEQSLGGSADYLYNEDDGSVTLYVQEEFLQYAVSRDVELMLATLVNTVCEVGGELTQTTATLHLTAAVEPETYESAAPADFPGAGVRVERLTVTRSPMELNYAIEYTVTDRETYDALDGGLFFEFIDPDADESLPMYERRLLDGLSGGSGVSMANPEEDIATATQFVQRGTLGVSELHERYWLSAYSAWEMTRFEMREIAMEKVEE